jgi:hypothetical protein
MDFETGTFRPMAKKPNKNGASTKAEKSSAQGVYFLSLSLENVRCFGPKQTLDLSDGKGRPAQWTILLGNNGTGKTTLLHTLVIEQYLDRLISKKQPLTDSLSAFVGAYVREASSQQPAGRVVNIARGTRLTSAAFIAEIRSTVGRLGFLKYDHGPVPVCCAYGASRRLGSSALASVQEEGPVDTLFSDLTEVRNAEEWLLQLDYASAKHPRNGQLRHRFNLVKDLLLKIMPESEVEDIRCDAGSGTHPKPKVDFKTPYGWVPLRQLGYGYQTLIAWMVDFASRMVERYPDSPDPLAEPAVVLVDEIDLHLHPTWQRKLIGFLTARFPNTQFIATAHSPLVVQAATGAKANLAVLRREGDHVVIDQSFKGLRNWSVEQLLTSELFGLESPWPPTFDKLLARRTELLEKAKLTKSEKAELKDLDEQIASLPPGNTAKETREILELTRTTQELLKQYNAQRQ